MKRFLPAAHNFRAHPVLVGLVLLALLTSRRWQQVVSPQVWSEEGTQVLARYITNGWWAIFEPVNGYLITIPKLISHTAISASFAYYPAIALVLTWLFITGVCLAVAYSPTMLRGPVFCAIAVLIVPLNPEVFGLPLYTFWWSSLLLFLVALWDPQVPKTGLRLAYIFVGGLSSPLIVAIPPVLYFRVFLYRSRGGEKAVAATATVIAGVQLALILQNSAGSAPPVSSFFSFIIPKFFGYYLSGPYAKNVGLLWLAGLTLSGLIAGWLIRDRHRPFVWMTTYLLIVSIALVVVRVDPAIINTLSAGPRYFFLSYVITSWILIQLFIDSADAAWVRTVTGVVLTAAYLNAVTVWSRDHDELMWKDHINSCRAFVEYAIPVHTDGKAARTWAFVVPGTACFELLAKDIMTSAATIDALPTFPFTTVDLVDLDRQKLSGVKIVENSMAATIKLHAVVPGGPVICVFNKSDAETRRVVLELQRGDTILYRSGSNNTGQRLIIKGHEREFLQSLVPSEEWIGLSFANRKLPQRFTLIIEDGGKQWGEWSAFAIAPP